MHILYILLCHGIFFILFDRFERNVIFDYHLDSLSKKKRKRKLLRVILAFTIFDKYDGCRIDKSFGINCVRKRLMRIWRIERSETLSQGKMILQHHFILKSRVYVYVYTVSFPEDIFTYTYWILLTCIYLTDIDDVSV